MSRRQWSFSSGSTGCSISVRSIMATHCARVARYLRIWLQNLLALYFSTTMSVARAVMTGVSAASWKLEWHAGMVENMRSSDVMAVSQLP